MSLADEIAQSSKEIQTDGYPMSIGEIMNLYQNGELDIHPEFQRFYRWKEDQKSKLIESILIGIPIPPIFVFQRADGVWDVIDGLQRLSTIFQFAGILVEEDGTLSAPLVLDKTTYLPSLKGKRWESDDEVNSFSTSQRMYFKRAKLDIKIIKKESDPQSKYELFMRVNKGGSQLSDQEVRNCLLVMENRSTFEFIRDLATSDSFTQCVSLSDRLIEEQYHLEIAFRFIIYRELSVTEAARDNVGDFLDIQAINIAKDQSFDYDKERQLFRTTFDALAAELASDSFRRYSSSKNRFLGPFLISAFETVAMGLGYNYSIHQGYIPIDLTAKVKSLWDNTEFLGSIGSGVRATSRIPVSLRIGRELFRP